MSTRRLSVTLEPADESAVRAFQTAGTPEHGALVSWASEHAVDPQAMRSEAALLRVLLRIGADTLRQRALERGYERLAASHSEVDGAEVLRARRRHVDRTADL